MKYGRTFNFSAGPAMMPEPVLEEIRDEMMNYRGSGMCVMAHHRLALQFYMGDEPVGPLQKVRLPHLSVLQVHRPLSFHYSTQRYA